MTITGLDVAFGGPKLLDSAQLTLEPRERVCLIGRNGEGKSTLLKVIAGQLSPDAGEIIRMTNLRVAMMQQEVPEGTGGTVFDVAVEGAGELAGALRDYHHESMKLASPDADTEAVLARMAELQNALELQGGWALEQRVEAALTKLNLDADAVFDTLSGGMKRRVMLARALVGEPDLLLLDEPTNHLDLESVKWLEQFLSKLEVSILFITHDRAFLRALATRIVELDRGQLTSYDCGYDKYLERKQVALEAEAKQNAVFDKKLAQEESWLRQGIKARRTRNEGRVRALKQLRSERAERREQREGAAFAVQEGTLSGRKVIKAEDLGFAYGERVIVEGFSSIILRGDKVGIIGPNGSGKTTLIKLLLGELAPVSGTVKLGTNLQVAYFDQHRGTLDTEKSVAWNVAGDSDNVMINGRKRHIYGYLQDFLFPPDRARSPVKALSGGERNRLLLARLFSREANLLVMDEPTNDLDLETLELLESIVVEFNGTVLLVSHDREFLNRVVTSTIAIRPGGRLVETVGGYDECERTLAREQAAMASTPVKKKPSEGSRRQDRPRVISQKEQRELDTLPAKIESLEARLADIIEHLALPEVASDGMKAKALSEELSAVETEMEGVYARWEALDALPRKA